MELEKTWRRAFLRARDAIDVRMQTDRETMLYSAPLYQMALDDATSSEAAEAFTDDESVDNEEEMPNRI